MEITHLLADESLSKEETLGYDIVINACERPFFKILENAGLSQEAIYKIESDIKETGDLWSGFNPRIDNIVNMFEAGIIDPTKVTRLALENAASVAGTLLITEAVVSINKEDKDDKPAGIDPSMLLG